MNNRLLRNLMWAPAFVLTLLIGSNVSAATFTAVASGNWSSSTTWSGGTAPGGTISNSDNVVIGAGIVVNLDQNVEFNNALSSLQVLGSLTTSNSSDLTITAGTLLGAGIVTVDELALGVTALVTFTGNLTANTLQSAATGATLALNLTVNQTLELTGGVLNIGTGAIVGLQNNSTIIVNGGSLALTGTGILTLTSNYNVVYNGSSAIAGLELAGTGLNNVTINLANSSNAVGLTGDLIVDGMLSLQGGQLSTNGNDITLNGGFMASGSGAIVGNSSSNLILNGSTGGSLAFAATSQTVNNFTNNLPSSAVVNLDSDLQINGTLSNVSGTLDISDVALTISGNITGNGNIQTNSASSLTLDGGTSINGDLNIVSTGSTTSGTIGDLTIDLSGTNTVLLGTDVTVSGILVLSSGALSINGKELTIAGNISGTGTGNLNGGATSSIVIATNGSVTGNLTLGASGQAQVLDELIIDMPSNATMSLGSNITVNGMLDLKSGSLNVNGNTITSGPGADIMLNADAAVTGTGNFNGSAGYDLTVTGDGDVDLGILGSGTGMGNLVVDLDNDSSSLSLGNDVSVGGNLDLQGGNLDLNGNDLTINGDVIGGMDGNITSNGASNITINSATSTTGGLSFSGGSTSVGNFTVNIQDGGSVSILSDLTVEDNLTFTSGMVMLTDGNLTMATGAVITGADSDSYIVTSGDGGLWMDIAGTTTSMFAVGTENDFTPAEITLNGATNGMFGVRVDEGVWSNGTSGNNSASINSVVNATWYVESSITSNLDMDLQVEWTSAMEVNGFERDSAYVSHYISGAWDMDATSSATAEASGSYSLTRTGITSLSPFAVFDKNATVGIRELAATEDLYIFPNPAIDVVTIPTGFEVGAIVKIIDLNGATIMEMNGDNNQNVTVDISTLSNGIYIVKVIGENSVSTGRFVKN